MHSNFALEMTENILKTNELCLTAHCLDDLLECFLSKFLLVDYVKNAEVLLFNKSDIPVLVATARKKGPKGVARQEIRVQSWMLNSPIRHTIRRIQLSKVQPVFYIPLLKSGGLLGFLSIELDRILPNCQFLLRSFYITSHMLAAKINEVLLNNEIQQVKSELQGMVINNSETRRRVTDLSKELYAISAISTKINQSMDFKKSLSRSMAKIRDVFKTISILIYIKKHGTSMLELSAMDINDMPLYPDILKKIEKGFLQDIINTGKPIIIDVKTDFYLPDSKNCDIRNVYTVTGVPLRSKKAITGALVLLHQSPNHINRDSLRLLSGIASIMGIAIENKNLYRQVLQKKQEAAFLVRSIAKFNETLNLKQTLQSVAEKGAEFIGKKCHVYLISETRVPMIQVTYQKRKGKISLKSQIFRSVQPKELENFYRFMKSHKKSVLIKNINNSSKIKKDITSYFQARGIHSLITVPLGLRGKRVGLLLLSSQKGKRPFSHHDLTIAKALGAAASVAIENAEAFSTSLELSDFLEKKITEKTIQIQRIQERQKIRIENRKDIIFRINLTNRLIFVNKAMETLTGCSSETFYRGDIRFEEMIAEEDRDRIMKVFRQILSGAQPMVKDLEYRHLNQKGEVHLMSLTVYPEKDSAEQIIGLEGVGRDITEQKRLEAELEKTKNLALLGEFSGALAHQIRNPLGNILVGTNLLRKVLKLDNPGLKNDSKIKDKFTLYKSDKENLGKIFSDLSEGINNLNQVVEDLLDYTKTLKLNRSSQGIDVIVKETLKLFNDAIKQKNIIVEEYFDPLLPSLSVDAVLISQVFQNVIHNAMQAMQNSGYLSITSGFSSRWPGYAFISITDTGIGIEPSEIEKIFHPFYSTKDSGTGLGLALSYRIIEAHNGTIWASSNSSIGTTFNILLPLGGQQYQDTQQYHLLLSRIQYEPFPFSCLSQTFRLCGVTV